MDEHSIWAALDKVSFVKGKKEQLEKQEEAELNDDLRIHGHRLKKALKTKQTIIADKHEMLVHSHQMEHSFHAGLKDADEKQKEEALKQDIHSHEECMKRAAHRKQELLENIQAKFECDIEEHQKKAALRRASLTHLK